jgi:hypothetical protein
MGKDGEGAFADMFIKDESPVTNKINSVVYMWKSLSVTMEWTPVK